MKFPRPNWRLGRSAVLICLGGVWAWKIAEFAYQERKKRDPLGQTPWGYVISLDLPVFATITAGLGWAGVKLVREFSAGRLKHRA